MSVRNLPKFNWQVNEDEVLILEFHLIRENDRMYASCKKYKFPNDFE